MDDTFYTSTEAFGSRRGPCGLNFASIAGRGGEMSLLTEAGAQDWNAPALRCALAREVMGEGVARCDLGGLMEYRRSLTPRHYPWALATTKPAQALNPESRVMRAARPATPWGCGGPGCTGTCCRSTTARSRRARSAWARPCAENNIARIQVYDWLLRRDLVMPKLGKQHGRRSAPTTTCAPPGWATIPRPGVVDRSCQVHGLGNLYIGGSSAFATSG